MQRWSRKAKKTPNPAALRGEQAIAALVRELKLVTIGTPRVEPANADEAAFAEKYRAAARDCRNRFHDRRFDLPHPPAALIKLLGMINDPEISTRKLGRAMLRDPLLTAKFLRIANSPAYAGDQPVKSVQVAIERLGMQMVRAMLLAIAVNSVIIRAKRLGDAADILWEHSARAGLAAQSLAAGLHLDQAEAFVLGLLHDIGKLPALLLIEELATLQAWSNPGLVETLVDETHAAMGGALVEVWNMPCELRVTIAAHHSATSLADAMQCHLEAQPQAFTEQCVASARLSACAILADRALGALGLAREPGDLAVVGSRLAVDLGLSLNQTAEYLRALPRLLSENDLRSL